MMLSKKQENNRTLITAPLTLAWREKEREFDLILHFIFELLQAFQFSLLQNKTRSHVSAVNFEVKVKVQNALQKLEGHTQRPLISSSIVVFSFFVVCLK